MADVCENVKSFVLNNYSREEIRNLVLSKSEPLRFPKASVNWPCSGWTPEFLAGQLGNVQTTFRICARVGSSLYKFPLSKVVTETDCVYAKASFLNFCAWLKDDLQNAGDLAKFPRANYWCYADYKYMADIFKDFLSLRQAPLWETFGFQEVTGDQSTIWIGSDGSYTPCHLDTYGCNLVAQIYGRKKWVLFPPSETDKLYPTRIPYEESSIFSHVNIQYPDLSLSPEYHTAIKYEVILEPGDVLLVPRHWWHFVESLEASISMNTWITLESDHVDRIREAVTRTLVCSMKQCEEESSERWLNPTEEITPHNYNMNYIRQAVKKVITGQAQNGLHQGPTISNNDIVDCITSPEIVATIANRLLAKARNKLNSEISSNSIEGSITTSNVVDTGNYQLSSENNINNNASFKEPSQNSCNCLGCAQERGGPGMRTRGHTKRSIQDGEVFHTCCKDSPTKKKKRP